MPRDLQSHINFIVFSIRTAHWECTGRPRRIINFIKGHLSKSYWLRELFISHWHIWRKFTENSTTKETHKKCTQNSTKGSEILLSILWTYWVCAFYTVLKKKPREIQIHSCSNPQIPIPQNQCFISLSSCLLQPQYWERHSEWNKCI